MDLGVTEVCTIIGFAIMFLLAWLGSMEARLRGLGDKKMGKDEFQTYVRTMMLFLSDTRERIVRIEGQNFTQPLPEPESITDYKDKIKNGEVDLSSCVLEEKDNHKRKEGKYK